MLEAIFQAGSVDKLWRRRKTVESDNLCSGAAGIRRMSANSFGKME